MLDDVKMADKGALPDKGKIVLYTQRVEVVESYGERRDCADQEIPRFLMKSILRDTKQHGFIRDIN